MNKKQHVPDKNEQILRAIAMKRESYFQLILSNLLRNESVPAPGDCANEDGTAFDFNKVVDVALKTADHAIELLYPIKPAE